VQPESLPVKGDYQVKVFLGPNQGRLPVSLVSTLQPLGERVEYIQLEAAGRNALDFHIAYYIGELASKDPSGHFHIISADSGFDPLIRHLVARGITVRRTPLRKASMPSAIPTATVELAVKDLANRKESRPKKRATLLNTLKSSVGKQLPKGQLQLLFDELQRQGLVSVDGERVAYGARITNSAP